MTQPIETNEARQPEEKVIMTISILKSGALKVTSPLMQDEAACYGVLEVAKRLIAKEHTKAESTIVRPPHNIINFMRNGKH